MPVNTKQLKQNIAFIKPVHSDRADNVIVDVKRSIIMNDYKSFVLDLSDFNLFDSIRIGTIVATYHFIQYINGKMTIIVEDALAKKTIENFKLDNATIKLAQTRQDIYHIA